MPIFCNVLFTNRREATQIAKKDIKLVGCTSCGHVYNEVFCPELLDYRDNYENSLHFSPHFTKYIEKLADDLVKKYRLYNKNVVEIGCGQGEFLGYLCDLGGNNGVGFDRAHRSQNFPNVKIVKDFYSAKYAHYAKDFICCRHVLEHIPTPQNFLLELQQGIKSATVFYFEVPNVRHTIENMAIWDIIYEHCSYFSASSLQKLFIECGFTVLDQQENFHGQFLGIEAQVAKEKQTFHPNFNIPWQDFRYQYDKKLSYWHHRLAEWQQQKVVLWGAGSKGVSFLNMLKIENIEYIVDLNPRKHNMYVSGRGQKIVPPDFLLHYKPDIIIVMNSAYLNEIQDMVQAMNLSCQFYTA